MPLDLELSVLVGVDCRLKPSSCSVMRRGTAVLLLWNSPLTSTLAAYTTAYLSILHSVWIGPFAGGGRFGFFWVLW